MRHTRKRTMDFRSHPRRTLQALLARRASGPLRQPALPFAASTASGARAADAAPTEPPAARAAAAEAEPAHCRGAARVGAPAPTAPPCRPPAAPSCLRIAPSAPGGPSRLAAEASELLSPAGGSAAAPRTLSAPGSVPPGDRRRSGSAGAPLRQDRRRLRPGPAPPTPEGSPSRARGLRSRRLSSDGAPARPESATLRAACSAALLPSLLSSLIKCATAPPPPPPRSSKALRGRRLDLGKGRAPPIHRCAGAVSERGAAPRRAHPVPPRLANRTAGCADGEAIDLGAGICAAGDVGAELQAAARPGPSPP